MEFEGFKWFNVSAPQWLLKYPVLTRLDHRIARLFGRRWWVDWRLLCVVRLWNLFRRHTEHGKYWGFGVLQIRNRHLFAVINGESLMIDVAFIHVHGRPE